MSNFLAQVISAIKEKNKNLSDITFILPNRRSGTYLKKNIKEQLDKPILSPEIITFENLAENISGMQKTPSIDLLFEFYKVYKEITPPHKCDTFEIFTHWANIILNDFNLMDNHLVNQKDVFNTLKDINIIQNWEPNTELTKNYYTFLQKLEVYYNAFHSHLINNQKAYQGMLFRKSAEKITQFTQDTNKFFVFVGFSNLKKTESIIIQALLTAHKAEIYWDIPKAFKSFYQNQKTYFDQYFDEWDYYKTNKPLWVYNDEISNEGIEITGISKKVGMLKYAGNLLQKQQEIEDTALILADQNVLPAALQALPEYVENINITMGVPLNHFPFSDIINQLFHLHTHQAAVQKGFYYENVLKILHHPSIYKLDVHIKEAIKYLTSLNKVYLKPIDLEESFKLISLKNNEILQPLFETVQKGNTIHFLKLLNDFIKKIKENASSIEREVYFNFYKLNQQLLRLVSKYPFIENLNSLAQIYRQLMFSDPEISRLNFIGEPLKGLQLMGFLESQTLDFKQLILVSANEGILPKNTKKESFIPFDVRKTYQIPTYIDDEITEAYLFFRLMQRSEKVSLLYNTDTDTFGGGEVSRFITKLMWENPQLKHQIVDSQIPLNTLKLQNVQKTPVVIEEIKQLFQKGISPSALISYIYNPINFYRNYILKIKDLDEIEENIVDKTLGNVVHGALELLYKPFVGQNLEREKLTNSLQKIEEQVIQGFAKYYPNGNIEEGKNKLIFEVAVNFIKRFIKQEIQLLVEGHTIKIIDLEKEFVQPFTFDHIDFPIIFKGKVDRIDEFDGTLRIIDYKTGKVEPAQMRTRQLQEKLHEYKFSKAVQLMMYSCMVSQNFKYNFENPIEAGIISFKSHKNGFMPVNFANNNSPDYHITSGRQREFLEILEELLLEILDPEFEFLEKAI